MGDLRKLVLLMTAALATSALPIFARADGQTPKKPTVPAVLLHLEDQLYARGYHNFLKDLRGAHPELNLGTTAFPPPPFNPALVRNDWLATFPAWTLSQRASELKSDPAAAAKLPTVKALQDIADELFSSYYQNRRYAHFSALEDMKPAGVSAEQTLLKARRIITPLRSTGRATTRLICSPTSRSAFRWSCRRS